MGEIVRFPESNLIEKEAADWIARLQADDVTPADQAQFLAWHEAHPAHARAYAAMSATLRAFQAAGPLVRAVSFGQSMNDAAQYSSAAVQPEVGPDDCGVIPASVAAHRRSTARRLVAGAIAAGIAAVAFTLFLMQRVPETRFQTATGEHASVALPDGSVVDLNSGSAVRVVYTDRARMVLLEHGEAFFNVAHDTSRPFWVVGGGSWVRAVGTAFNVYVRPDDVLVTVSDGVVQVGQTGDAGATAPVPQVLAQMPASVLSAGQQLVLDHGAASIRTLPNADLEHQVAWRSGRLSFDHEPLGEVIDDLSRYTTLRLIIRNDELRSLPVGGTFQASPNGAETLIELLKDGFHLSVTREGDRVFISNEVDSGK